MKEIIMATVKIHEGTKFETTVDLQEDEGVIFVRPEKNKLLRFVSLGCFKGNKNWQIYLVITSKRIMAIPFPPNKKNYPVESYYWKDITKARAEAGQNAQADAQGASFSIGMKPGQTSSCTEGGTFQVLMAMTAGNLFKAVAAMDAQANAANAGAVGASLRMAQGQDYVYTKASLDRYYANMAKQAQDRAANIDFSKASHSQIRDYIVNLINDCVAEANKG
jgi:hypothetical protein